MELIDYKIPNWALCALINGDYDGLTDEDMTKIETFVSEVVAKFGNANFMLGNESDELGFCHYNDIDNLGADCSRLYINPSK